MRYIVVDAYFITENEYIYGCEVDSRRRHFNMALLVTGDMISGPREENSYGTGWVSAELKRIRRRKRIANGTKWIEKYYVIKLGFKFFVNRLAGELRDREVWGWRRKVGGGIGELLLNC